VAQAHEVHRRLTPAPLVVDHDGVARHLCEPAIDLDDGDPACSQELGGVRTDGRHDHTRRAHREECARTLDFLRRLAVVAEHHHLVIRFAQDLLDAGREPCVELVGEVGNDDADNAASCAA